jgi:hypothetical protein
LQIKETSVQIHRTPNHRTPHHIQIIPEIQDGQEGIPVHEEEIHVHQEGIMAAKQENERVEKIKINRLQIK